MGQTSAQTAPPAAGFAAWARGGLSNLELHVAVKREHGQWFALLVEFDITGCGDTRPDAITEAFELLADYLVAYYEDGKPVTASLRPISRRLKTRIELESLLARALRHIPVETPLRDESTYALPPGVLPGLAPC